jgi:hypothetical protein
MRPRRLEQDPEERHKRHRFQQKLNWVVTWQN